MSDAVQDAVGVQQAERTCVIALHCSLGSGRQWSKLAAALGPEVQVIAPDLAGYGSNPVSLDLPMTLAQEVESLREALEQARGPIHLVGHSYGGTIAFKIATASAYASRVRSLTLIEPILPTLLVSTADRRLRDRFVALRQELCQDLAKGSVLEVINKFAEFWRGSGPREEMSPAARIRMIEHAERLAFDFSAALGEANPTMAAAALRLPTLLFSGGQSPFMTQRIVELLAAIMDGVQIHHLPDAGHMLPLTHAASVNPEIVRHIALVDELASRALAAGRRTAAAPAGA